MIRLEGLNTCTREFVALEGVSSVSLVDHILQATSEPKFEPLPQPPPRSQQSQSARPLRPVLGPAYPVDETSFVDACKRLAAAEGLCRGCSGKDGDEKGATTPLVFPGAGSGDQRGQNGMLSAPMELLLRAIQSLASFRYTIYDHRTTFISRPSRNLGPQASASPPHVGRDVKGHQMVQWSQERLAKSLSHFSILVFSYLAFLVFTVLDPDPRVADC